MKQSLTIIALSALTGCASIAGERQQSVMVQTVYEDKEVSGVGCKLTNDSGSWFVTTPASTPIHKSTEDLAITCKKEPLSGSEILVSKSNGIVWGNILFGGVIGYVVDRNTGAGFDYPATATVTMRKIGDAPTIPVNAPSAP
jgi:hypothetical protein